MDDKKNTSSAKKPLVVVGLFGIFLGLFLSLLTGYVLVGKEGLAYLQATYLVKHRFVGDYTWSEVRDDTMEAMVASLGDRWSYYLNEEDYTRVVENRSNHYVGIGITVSYTEENEIVVLKVEKHGPAAKAGILPYDIIRFVVSAENKETVVDMLGGPEGSEVVLEVETAGEESRTVNLTRSDIAVESISHEMLGGEIGYVRITNFYTDSGEQFCDAVDALLAQGAKGMVFDLRQNPGGYVVELTEMLDKLLPEQKIFVQKDVDGKETVYSSDADCVELPFVVLLDEHSYSAAEFFGAALREAVGATILGQTTSGKGYAQSLHPLADGTALGLSTSRYYTGGGVSLIGTGVEPDEFAGLIGEKQVLFASGILPLAEDDVVNLALSYFK